MISAMDNIREIANKIIAKDIMTSDVLTVYEGWSIKRLSDFFIKHNISGAPVIASDHSLVGVVSVTDIVRFDNLPTDDKAAIILDSVYPEFLGQKVDREMFSELTHHANINCTINSIMTRDVISVDKTTNLTEISQIMYQSKIRRIFVTEDGIIAGVISTGNILRWLSGDL